MRFSRIHPLLDALTSGILGAQTQDNQEAPRAYQEDPLVLVS
jgi:hypothetical protein